MNRFRFHALRVRALLVCAALLITTAAMAASVKVQSVTLSPTSVPSGQPASCTIVLTAAAGKNGVNVTLTSSNPSVVSTPASVFIAQGLTSATTTVQSSGVGTNTTVTITASLSNSVSAPLTVLKPDVQQITMNPTGQFGGLPATANVLLTGTAPAGGTTVALSSSNPSLAAPSGTCVVPAGQTLGFCNIATFGTAVQTRVYITATITNSATTDLDVIPPDLDSVTVSPSEVTALNSTTVTVALVGKAPSGGTVVSLGSSDSSVVALPATITVPAGASTASVNVTPAQVASSSTYTISANLGTTTKTTTLRVDPCFMSVPSVPAVNPRDVWWWEDQAGTLTAGSWTRSEVATGSWSLTNGAASGAHAATLTSLQPLSVNAGENLVLYLVPNSCSPPREIVVGWHTTGGVWKSAYYGSALIGGEGSMPYLGAVPGSSAWTRLELPASTLGLVGSLLDGFTIQSYDGQVWADHGFKICTEVTSSAPTMPAGDTIWIDDALPAGAIMNDGVFDTTQHASGAKGIYSPYDVQLHTNSGPQIDGATATLPVHVGESLFFYMMPSTCTTPVEIKVDWYTTTGEIKTAFWGTPLGYFGETTVRGPLPSTPVWTRLEIPASVLGLEERTINGIHITFMGGTGWIDAIGKSGTACGFGSPTAPPIQSIDTLWIDDSDRANVYGIWDTSQKASGAQSLTTQLNTYGELDETGNTLLPIFYGEKMLLYLLVDPCAVPSTIDISWIDINGYNRSAHWGPYQYGPVNMGPVPAAGSWVRAEIPASQLQFEDHTLQQIKVYFPTGSRIWLDAIGKTGIPCTMPRASQPAIAPGDDVWIDDGPSPYDESGDMVDASQSATGSNSYTAWYSAPDGSKQLDFINLNKPIGYGDTLVFYYLNDMACNPSNRLAVFWTGGGGNLIATWGNCRTNEICMGPIDTSGNWTRAEVPASLLGIEGYSANMMVPAFTGQLWIDHIGVVHCTMPAPNAAQPPSSDTVWIDDDIPAGASSNIVWAMDQTASGIRSIGGLAAGPTNSFVTTGLNLTVNTGDALVFYALQSTCKTPSNIVLGVGTSDGGSIRAYWGTPSSGEPPSSVNMGALPAAGQWVRYTVPASALGIEGKTITSLTNEYTNGIVWIDHIGSAATP